MIAARASALTDPGYAHSPTENNVVNAPAHGLGVNTRTGNVFIERALFYIPARGIPVQIRLAYNATDRAKLSAFGYGWSFSYATRFVRDADGSVSIVWGDGRVDRFALVGSAFVAPSGVYMTLTETVAGDLRLLSRDGILLRFADASHQRLTSISDPPGNTLTLTYDSATKRRTSIADAAGRSYTFTYNSTGLCTSIQDTNLGNRTFGLSYDAQLRLTAITNPLGLAETFTYSDDNVPLTIRDRRNNAATLTYATPAASPHTRLLAGITKGGRLVSFTFDNNTTTLTDGRGNPWQYRYDGSGNLSLVTAPGGAQTTYSWDGAKNLLAFTDAMGVTTTYTHENGKVVTLRNALNDGPAFVYGPCARVANAADARGLLWSYEYNASTCALTSASTDVSSGMRNWTYDAYPWATAHSRSNTATTAVTGLRAN